MGYVTVHFLGLCTHLSREDAPEIPLAHRVVLLSNPDQVLNGKTVKAHTPEVILHGTPAGQSAGLTTLGAPHFRPNAVKMRIKNPSPSEDLLVLEDSFRDAIPRLTPPGMTLELDPAVAYFGKTPASVYFDIQVGRMIACRATAKGAVGSRLELATEGKPVLEVVPFDADESDVRTIELEEDEVIIVLTDVAGGADDEYDYYLNYGIILNPPEDPPPPVVPDCELVFCGALPVHVDVGPRCSNSNYP